MVLVTQPCCLTYEVNHLPILSCSEWHSLLLGRAVLTLALKNVELNRTQILYALTFNLSNKLTVSDDVFEIYVHINFMQCKGSMHKLHSS